VNGVDLEPRGGATPIRGVRKLAPGFYSVRSEPEPRGPIGRTWLALRKLLLGAPLPSRLERSERLGLFAALALPISIAIVGLLAVLAISYQQTISAYPNGAGGYIVASENLGRLLSLVAAGALLVDYTLDVSVSIATGIQSLTSAVPFLSPGRLWLSLLALAIITLANLRGIRAAGALFSAPVHIYIVVTLGVLIYGGIQLATTVAAVGARPAAHRAGGAARDAAHTVVASAAAQLSRLAVEVDAAVPSRNLRPQRAVLRPRLARIVSPGERRWRDRFHP
jgi:hypothetical protein